MARIEKTIFISYRRRDISWALAVYQSLTKYNYDVFFDYTSIPSGDFEQIISSNIKARAHFILILTPTALDRCSEPGDWLRREIETAVDEKRNIIPLFFDGFSFSSPSIAEKLTGKLRTIKRYNGLDIYPGYFMEAIERLRGRYLNVALDAVLHPIPDEVQKIVVEQKIAANEELEKIAAEKKAEEYERRVKEAEAQEKAKKEERERKERAEKVRREKEAREKAERETAEKAARERNARLEAQRLAEQQPSQKQPAISIGTIVLFVLGTIGVLGIYGLIKAAGSFQGNTPRADSLLADIENRGYIMVSTDPNYEPQSFLNPEGQRPSDTKCPSDALTTAEMQGFDVDVAKAIGDALGVETCFATPSWDAITAGIWADNWDVSVGSMTVTASRYLISAFPIITLLLLLQYALTRALPQLRT